MQPKKTKTVLKKRKTPIIKKNDKLWSEIIKIRAGYRCEVCFATGRLNAHHWAEGRANKRTRWNLNNGVCLCFRCHREAHDSSPIFLKKLKLIYTEYEYEKKLQAIIIQARHTEPLLLDDYNSITIALQQKKKLLQEQNPI